ncbi:hypothetical protein [Halobacillus sp. B23F22_1]|uniref:hypothetical protein n=1 Tax=Halobacillus sp. B23F22_1 TaxID=3459514 RepID=UPI00373E6E42
MEEQLLKEAKQFQKERHWFKAVQLYEQYIKVNKDEINESVYAEYARSLRINSQTDKAIATLENALTHYPGSERLLLEFHNLYDFLGEWDSAERAAQSLVKLSPHKANYHFRLGRTYSFLNKKNNAKKCYQKALELVHQCSFDELISRIQSGFIKDNQKVKTRYIFIDGKNNLGAFIHKTGQKTFFTKIANYTNAQNGAGREENYYKEVRQAFPQLQSVSPQYIDAQVIDKISYLTIERLEASPVTLENSQLVIEAAQKAASVPYSRLIGRYPIPNYVFQFKKGRAISVVHFFTHIHEKTYNEKMFESIQTIITQYNYSNTIKHLMKRLQSAVMDNQLYQRISPEEHYTLQHGDLAFQNLMVDRKEGTVKIIDWPSYTAAPHFIDIARYFTSIKATYEEVKNLYLLRDSSSSTLPPIEEVFFLYALIVFYFQKLGPITSASRLSEFILPALEDLEQMILHIQHEEKGDEMKKTFNAQQLEEKELQIQQLKQRNKVLSNERSFFQDRLTNLQNSKSWKITRPLRLLTEGRLNKNKSY